MLKGWVGQELLMYLSLTFYLCIPVVEEDSFWKILQKWNKGNTIDFYGYSRAPFRPRLTSVRLIQVHDPDEWSENEATAGEKKKENGNKTVCLTELKCRLRRRCHEFALCFQSICLAQYRPLTFFPLMPLLSCSLPDLSTAEEASDGSCLLC